MTFVYGSTLKSNMDYVALGMLEQGIQPIKDSTGKILYSLNKLSVPPAKAIRQSVQATVPAATHGMEWLQRLARGAAGAVRWITPAGVPVVSWAEGREVVNLRIRSMGVSTILMQRGDGVYNTTQAAARISPNFVHSLDSAHLALLLSSVKYNVMPIHDSFGVLPNHVSELRDDLRGTFYAMYSTDVTAGLLSTPMAEGEEFPERPVNGAWDLSEVLSSRFCFC